MEAIAVVGFDETITAGWSEYVGGYKVQSFLLFFFSQSVIMNDEQFNFFSTLHKSLHHWHSSFTLLKIVGSDETASFLTIFQKYRLIHLEHRCHNLQDKHELLSREQLTDS